MGLGFVDDPLLHALGVRRERHTQFFRMLSFFTRKLADKRVLYIAGGGDAAAIAAYSTDLDATRPTPWDYIHSGALAELALMPPSSWGPCVETLSELVASGEALKDLGMSEPYLKVVALATRPSARGAGLSARIMQALVERSDAEGVDLYLEAAPTGVDRFYRDKFGFQTVGELKQDLPHLGLIVQLMWRPAARRRAGGHGAGGGSGGGCGGGGSGSGGSGSGGSGSGGGGVAV